MFLTSLIVHSQFRQFRQIRPTFDNFVHFDQLDQFDHFDHIVRDFNSSKNTTISGLLTLRPCPHDTFPNQARSITPGSPVSTWEQPERSFRFLETTSRHGTIGRSVSPCRLCRVNARPGASDLSATQPLLARAFLVYFFPFNAHVRFHMSSIDYPNMPFWSKADTRTLISIWGDASIQNGRDNCRRTVEVKSITKQQTVRIKSINSGTFGTKLYIN